MAWLENDGMGVCGYTYSEVQEMPIDALARAINSRTKRDFAILRGIGKMFFGESEPDPEVPKVSPRPANLALFDALFA